MVERAREAQGSIPCFSTTVVVFEERKRKKTTYAVFENHPKICFTRIPVDRTARKIVNTNLDQTKRTKIKSPLSGLNQ